MSIRIVSWNVNGIRAAARKGMLEWLHTERPDILALQETKASPEQLPLELRAPRDYHADWCAANKRGYSGVATFSRRDPLDVGRGIGEPRFDDEGRVLISTFPEFTLYNVYFPSGSSGEERVAFKLEFYRAFLEHLRPRLNAGERLVIVGDVNTAYAPIDLARPRENVQTSGFRPEERAALGEFFAAGLIDTFRLLHPESIAYSWWSQRVDARARNVGWRLDYILVSPALRDLVQEAAIHPNIEGSDHCPVSVTFALPA